MNKCLEIRYDRNFDTLLLDSIDLLFTGLRENFEFSQTFARSSMLNSILLLELSANVCIETLSLERSVFNEVDRLSILGKYDFYLRTSFRDKKLDRGVKVVEAIKDLKKIRDGFVHMKPHKIEWEMENNGAGGTAELEKMDILDICKNPKGWDSDSAIIVMRSVHAFLKYFFRDKCRYSANKVSSFLLSEAEIPGNNEYLIPAFYKVTRSKLLGMGIDLRYVKLMWV